MIPLDTRLKSGLLWAFQDVWSPAIHPRGLDHCSFSLLSVHDIYHLCMWPLVDCLSSPPGYGVHEGTTFLCTLIAAPKKGNAKECSNYCAIALISHADKIIHKILQARLQQYVNCELPDVQDGFRKGRGTRDQIANIC